ncbi:unnamed protein product [Cochlearia groenlandica]
MPLNELTRFLKSSKIQVSEFDTLICGSGSEVYYPGVEDGKLLPDSDYSSHIDYRWGNEGLKNTVWKLMNTTAVGGEARNKDSPSLIQEDQPSSNEHCVAYMIKDSSKVMRIDDLRQKLRLRGLRCHPMYCRNSTRLQIVPLLASRSQALSGDTDYEELISGTHKTVIVKGLVTLGSDALLRSTDLRDDTVPSESPFIGCIMSDSPVNEITDILMKLSKATA